MRNKACLRRQGFAIILVLATLVLLALLSITYIKLALIDRNIARNYMDNKRAKLIAQSGIEYAVARIQENISGTSWQNLLGKTIKINGVDTNYTESAGSTYGQDRDIFSITVKDCNSMINVNDGLGNDRVTANTRRILNVLGDVVLIDQVKIGGNLGDVLLAPNKRPPQGYATKQELLKAINNDMGEFNKYKNYVTTHAWQDQNVANPVPLSSAVTADYPVKYNTALIISDGTSQNVYRYSRGYDKNANLISGNLTYAFDSVGPPDPQGYAHGIYGLDELNPQWIEIVSRSPVNINTAPREVLIALLKDLRGFFASDRRRNSPIHNDQYDMNIIKSDQSLITKYSFDYSPASPIGDEAGFLYTTKEIDMSLATIIADEIINKRNFKTWREFNAFCDDLVKNAVLDDTREIFYEYDLDPGAHTTGMADPEPLPTFDKPTVLSIVARKQASQAIADVLKANFNPNLHLNELNPDANIKTLVDKTDLIVNSTEFCFTPMGHFQIESEGLILKAQGTDNVVIANSKIEAGVKLFDAYRETNQKQFLSHIQTDSDILGFLGGSNNSTNNSRTIQIGPEPTSNIDQITYSKENEYSGYLSLPTIKAESLIGSPVTGTTTTTTSSTSSTSTTETTVENDTPKRFWTTKTTTTTTITLDKTIKTTSETTGTYSPTFYAQFKEDFGANYHADGDTYKPAVTNNNIADKTESGVKGPCPYSLNNRLARSFRKESDVKPSTIPGSYAYQTGSDLRIDGAYIERYAGLAYSFNGTSTNVIKNPGMLSYWIKPSFYPETAGKPRTFFSLTKTNNMVTGWGYSWYDSSIFGNFFFPTHWPVAKLSSETELLKYTLYKPDNIGYRSTSLIFAYSTYSNFGNYEGDTSRQPDGGIGHSTTILNHLSHFGSSGDPLSCHPAGTSPKSNYLKSGQWIHTACIWDLPTSSSPDPQKENNAQIWINGSKLPGSGPVYSDISVTSPKTVTMSDFLTASIFRIGESCKESVNDYIRNWTSDSTVDEFCIFSTGSATATITTEETGTKKTTITTVTEVYDRDGVLYSSTSDWQTSTEPIPPTTTTTPGATDDMAELANLAINTHREGRYYKPAGQESYFISQDFSTALRRKSAPQESRIPDPFVTSSSAIPLLDKQIRIIGISWSCYGEETDASGNAVIRDYKTYESATDHIVKPEVWILKNYNPATNISEAEYGPFDQDGYSSAEIEMDSVAEYRYKITPKIEGIDPLNTVLLYSPIFDDITIYFTGGVGFLSYQLEADLP